MNSRARMPEDHPAVKQRVRNYQIARAKMKSNCTSTWPADPITTLRTDSALEPILDPSSINPSASARRTQRKLMPAGYNDDEGICKVFVPSAPNVCNIKDQFMYRTCQERSLSQPFAPPPIEYKPDNPNLDRAKMTALDLVLERREKLKEEARKLEEEIDVRASSTIIPMDPPVNRQLLSFRPKSDSFSKTTFRLRPGTKSRAIDLSVNKWQVDNRPISSKTHRVIVSNPIPGSSFSWSTGWKTQNQIAGL